MPGAQNQLPERSIGALQRSARAVATRVGVVCSSFLRWVLTWIPTEKGKALLKGAPLKGAPLSKSALFLILLAG